MLISRNEKATPEKQAFCFHCGAACNGTTLHYSGNCFCCNGCKMVYTILNDHELCDYYQFNKTPGQSQVHPVRAEKFSFLDDEKIAERLISYKDEFNTHLIFYLPQIHCSSCLYLLEKLYRIEQSVISSTVNFERRELTIVFNSRTGSVRKMAELLTSIGYEPYLSSNDLNEKKPSTNKMLIYQLGVAGFCFGNIMLMSFPEYFGIGEGENNLQSVFRWLNFGLAIPVLLFSSTPFFQSSIKSLKHHYLHIDAPIALAILITFIRSCYELFTGAGAGYFDSMTGIVFFMLAGRLIQEKTYRQLQFDRDYTSYFPIAVTVIKNGKEQSSMLPELKNGDTIAIHNGELIPADGLLTRGIASIDYSFVTGENLPVSKNIGELVYAGGRQSGGCIEILIMKEVSQSYLTSLWSRGIEKRDKERRQSFVHGISKWFTWIVLSIAAGTAAFWFLNNPVRIWPAVTSIFIIACPCALLLSNSFTNGNILRILSRNGLFLSNAQAIENIGRIDHIVFDKTGTLTSAGELQITFEGHQLSLQDQLLIASVCRNSSHPLCRALGRYFSELTPLREVSGFIEVPGEGSSGFIDKNFIRIGSAAFISGLRTTTANATEVVIEINGESKGRFLFSNQYRMQVERLVNTLQKNFKVSVISGDNIAERERLRKMLGEDSTILFHQNPSQKMAYVSQLQEKGQNVMMLGDGLNDAGALQQSDCGIAVSENSNCFTPASDGIIDARSLTRLDKFITLCRANKNIVLASFIYSVIYNCIGLLFAVQGILSPLVAAILMPASSLSILLITFGSTNLVASKLRL